MFLVVNAKGQYWTGFEWGQQGKPFLTAAAATRSLHEEGEGLEETNFLEVSRDTP
jgi:hypothetical protein